MKSFRFVLTIVCAFIAICDALIWSINDLIPVWITVLMFLKHTFAFYECKKNQKWNICDNPCIRINMRFIPFN